MRRPRDFSTYLGSTISKNFPAATKWPRNSGDLWCATGFASVSRKQANLHLARAKPVARQQPLCRIVEFERIGSRRNRFVHGYDSLQDALLFALKPFGFSRFSKGPSAHRNLDQRTNTLFPLKRFQWICGTCNVERRKLLPEETGCCVFQIRMSLNVTSDINEPYYEVKEFCLPDKSCHILRNPQARQSLGYPNFAPALVVPPAPDLREPALRGVCGTGFAV